MKSKQFLLALLLVFLVAISVSAVSAQDLPIADDAISENVLDDDAIESSNSADKFSDSSFEWTYGGKFGSKFGSKSGKDNGPVITKRVVNSGDIPSASTPTFGKSVDSFLKNMNVGASSTAGAGVDLSQYKVGQAVFHKKFGEGVITGLDPEGDDYKVDIEFKNLGHKRLMLKFARLEIID